MPDKDINIHADSEGQLSFGEADNYYPVASDYVRIPRPFIERYSNVSYLANLGLMIAIQRIENRNRQYYVGTKEELYFKDIYNKTKTDYSDGLVSCIPISHFLSVYGLNRGGSMYSALDSLYNGESLRNQWQILYEDNNIVAGTSVLTGTMYDKQKKLLYMKFNPDLAPLITNIQKNYARLSLPVLGKLKEDYITQLYQILKEQFDFEQQRNRKFGLAFNREITIEYDIDQLLFLMGMYPVELDTGDSAMDMVVELLKHQDFRGAANILKDKHLIEKYVNEPMRIIAINSFRDFKRAYLGKCFNRINGFKMPSKLDCIDKPEGKKALEKYEELCREKHPTDIHFRFSLKKVGHGGKVSAIVFYVSQADWTKFEEQEIIEAVIPEAAVVPQKEPVADVITDEQYDIIDEIRDMVPIKISSRDATSIAKAANWQIKKIQKAVEVAENYNRPIENLVPFLIKAIEGDWSPAVSMEPDAEEEYPMAFIRKQLGYEDAIAANPGYEEPLELFMEYIYECLNSDATMVKIGQGKISAQTVKSQLLKLNSIDLANAVTAFLEGSAGKMITPAYILTILYRIKTQEGLGAAQSLHKNYGIYKDGDDDK